MRRIATPSPTIESDASCATLLLSFLQFPALEESAKRGCCDNLVRLTEFLKRALKNSPHSWAARPRPRLLITSHVSGHSQRMSAQPSDREQVVFSPAAVISSCHRSNPPLLSKHASRNATQTAIAS